MQRLPGLYKGLFILVWLIATLNANAQIRMGCATPKPAGAARLVPPTFSRTTDISGMRIIKLFVYVTRGEFSLSQPAQTEAEIMAHFEIVRQQFAPLGICFIIAGFAEIRSDALAFIDSDSDTDYELVRSYANSRPDCLSVFVHNDIAGDIIGTAWNIPNTFVSLEANYTWSGYPVLASHEIGHALGLLHTFEDNYGKELVSRTGSCSNCATTGDLICDTEADLNISNSNFNNNCEYIGGHRDSCNVRYLMETDNTMSYNSFTACVYKFTPQQGDRMHFTITTTPALTNLTFIPGSGTITSNVNLSSGNHYITYINSITINSPVYNITGVATMQMTSAEIILKPGVTLAPTGTGLTALRANVLCQ